MNRIELLNYTQDLGIEALSNSNFNGTVLVATGMGKSYMIQKTIYKALEQGVLKLKDHVWIMAEEVQARKRTFFETEIPGFEKIFGKNITKDFQVSFHSYQSGEKLVQRIRKGEIKRPVFIALDEAECVFTPSRINIFKLQKLGTRFCGYTGTTAATSPVYRDKYIEGMRQSDFDTKAKKLSDFILKGQCFDIFCPIVFERDLEWGIKNGILSPFETTLIEHEFGTKQKYLTISKKNNWIGSEKEYYKFYSGLVGKPTVDPGFKAIINRTKLPQMLYKMKSKVFVGKKLLELLPDAKVLLFGKELSFLRQLTDNVAEDYWKINGQVVYDLKQYKKDNNITKLRLKIGEDGITSYEKITTVPLLEAFDKGNINVIASSKRLQRGVTLKGLNTLIIFIAQKQVHILLQILGKL